MEYNVDVDSKKIDDLKWAHMLAFYFALPCDIYVAWLIVLHNFVDVVVVLVEN